MHGAECMHNAETSTNPPSLNRKLRKTLVAHHDRKHHCLLWSDPSIVFLNSELNPFKVWPSLDWWLRDRADQWNRLLGGVCQEGKIMQSLLVAVAGGHYNIGAGKLSVERTMLNTRCIINNFSPLSHKWNIVYTCIFYCIDGI